MSKLTHTHILHKCHLCFQTHKHACNSKLCHQWYESSAPFKVTWECKINRKFCGKKANPKYFMWENVLHTKFTAETQASLLPLFCLIFLLFFFFFVVQMWCANIISSGNKATMCDACRLPQWLTLHTMLQHVCGCVCCCTAACSFGRLSELLMWVITRYVVSAHTANP